MTIIILGLLPIVLPINFLERISPSHFPIYKKCMLGAVWASSSDIHPLLPKPPSAHLGIVIHKILEKAGKGAITDDKDFNSAWFNYISNEEIKMKSNWTEQHLFPLKKSVRYYEVKKYQCFMAVQRISPSGKPIFEKINHYKKEKQEVWLLTPDEKVGGFVDALIPENYGDAIIDYKTGIVQSDQINPNYEIQLKLYAALYNSMFNKWPISVEIVGINGISHPIPFTREECSNLLDEAYDILTRINKLITEKKNSIEVNSLADPSPEICRFCLYRPCCIPYWKKRELEPEAKWPYDKKGKVIEKKK